MDAPRPQSGVEGYPRAMLRALAFLLITLLITPALFAQDSDLARPLPVDSSITMGNLPNGMRYWVNSYKWLC